MITKIKDWNNVYVYDKNLLSRIMSEFHKKHSKGIFFAPAVTAPHISQIWKKGTKFGLTKADHGVKVDITVEVVTFECVRSVTFGCKNIVKPLKSRGAWKKN